MTRSLSPSQSISSRSRSTSGDRCPARPSRSCWRPSRWSMLRGNPASSTSCRGDLNTNLREATSDIAPAHDSLGRTKVRAARRSTRRSFSTAVTAIAASVLAILFVASASSGLSRRQPAEPSPSDSIAALGASHSWRRRAGPVLRPVQAGVRLRGLARRSAVPS